MLGKLVPDSHVHLQSSVVSLWEFRTKVERRTAVILYCFQSCLTSGWNLRASEKATLGRGSHVRICSANSGRWAN